MKKNIFKHDYNSLQKNILRFFILSFLVVFLIPGVYFIYLNKSANNDIVKNTKKLDSFMMDTLKVLEELSIDDIVIHTLSGENGDQNKAYRILYDAKISLDSNLDFYIVDTEGKVKLSNNAIILEAYSDTFLTNVRAFQNQSTEKGIEMFSTKVPYSNNYLMIHEIIKNHQNEKIGHLVFMLPEKTFQFLKSGTNKFALSDTYNNIMFTDVIEINEVIKDGRLVLNTSDYDLGWSYYSINSRNHSSIYKLYLYYPIQDVIILTIILCLYFITISISFYLFNKYYLNKLIKDNNCFVNEIKQALFEFSKGDLNYRISLDYSTESNYYIFIKKYNEVLDLVEDTILKNREIMNLANDAEKRLLNMQFNPHFIFNVLETIKYELSDSDNKAGEMMMSLAKIMRYSVYTVNDVIELNEDLNYIREYLKLQKFRFEDRLEYKISVDENSKEIRVPKLIIQPIIENSIKHGFDNELTLKILVEIMSNEPGLVIIIKDNGIGIDEKTLEILKSNIEKIQREEKVTSDKSIGLLNTVGRLQYYYPGKFSFNIKSEKGYGTNITIVIYK